VAGHLHLVAVEKGSRLGAQTDTVDRDFGFGNSLADDDLPIRRAPESRVLGEHSGSPNLDGAGNITAQEHFASRDREPLPPHLKQRHRRVLLRGEIEPEITTARVTAQGNVGYALRATVASMWTRPLRIQRQNRNEPNATVA